MVNTKTSISKKVLALVLAVACTIAFTPAIAFTQSAHAANAAATGAGGLISDTATAQAAFGTAAVVTGTTSDMTVTINNNTDLTLTTPVVVGQNIKLTVTSNGQKATDVKVIGSFKLQSGASLDIEGYTDVAPASSSAGTAAIDGTSMAAGNITVGENATVTGGAASAGNANGGDAIVVAGSATTVTTTTGSVVVNGTVTGGAKNGTGNDGYGVNLLGSGTYPAVALSGSGSVSSVNPSTSAWTPSTVTFSAEKSATNAASATVSALVAGNVLKASSEAITGHAYTVEISKRQTVNGKTTTTKVATVTGTAGVAAVASYVVTKEDASATFTAKVYEGSKVGSATTSGAAAVAAPTIADITGNADAVVGATDVLSTGAVTGGTAGQMSYQWYTNTADSTTGGTAIQSTSDTGAVTAGASTYKFTPAAAGTTYFYVVATDKATGLTATSKTFKVVATTSGFTTDLKDMQYNMQDDAVVADFGVKANVSGNITWYWNASAASETGAQVLTASTSYTAGATAAPGSVPTKPTAATGGSYYVYAKIITSDSKTYMTKIAKVTFNQAPVIDTTATDYNMSDATYLKGTSTAVKALAPKVVGKATGVTSQWYTNTTGTVDTAKDAKIATTDIYTPVITAAGTNYYYCVITQNGKTVTSAVAKITVNDKFEITTQPAAAKTVVVGADVALKVAYNDPNATVQWYKASTETVPANAAALAAAKLAGTITEIDKAQGNTYAPDTDVAGTYYYFAVVTDSTAAQDAHFTTMSTVTVKAPVTSVTTGNVKYTLSGTTAKAAKITKTSAKSITIAKTVSANGKTYKVTGIASKVFAKSKATTVTVKSTTLTKAGVKNCFKSSKVKTVKVPASKKSAYKKIFTKSNCGKTVTVK